jgi:hypothetical protein
MNNPKKRILIGTPMYGGKCYAVFTDSLLILQKVLLKNGYDIEFEFIVNESLITRARNEIVHVFMNGNFDYLLFIDGDHRFDSLGVLKMIQEDDDLICGIYPNKLINWKTVKEASELGVSNLEFFTGNFVVNALDKFTFSDFNKKVEIRYGGTGMMLVKKIVFEKLKSIQNIYQSDYGPHKVVEYFKTSVKDGYLLSEDYQLCEDWRAIGGKIYAALWLEMTHVGTYEFKGSIKALFDLEKRKQSVKA